MKRRNTVSMADWLCMFCLMLYWFFDAMGLYMLRPFALLAALALLGCGIGSWLYERRREREARRVREFCNTIVKTYGGDD